MRKTLGKYISPLCVGIFENSPKTADDDNSWFEFFSFATRDGGGRTNSIKQFQIKKSNPGNHSMPAHERDLRDICFVKQKLIKILRS